MKKERQVAAIMESLGPESYHQRTVYFLNVTGKAFPERPEHDSLRQTDCQKAFG